MDPNATPPGGNPPEQPAGGTPPSYPPPNQPYGQPPQGYTPPPQQGYAPPPQGYAPPPQQGYPPQQQGYPQQYAPPPQQGYPPPGFQQPYTQGQAPVVKKSGVPVFVWVIVGILVAFVVICGGFALAAGLFVNSAGNALKDAGNSIGAGVTAAAFDLALTTGDYETAHSYLGGNVASRYSTAQLKDKWTALNANGSVSTHFGAPKTSNGKTTITWTVIPSGKSAINIELTMDTSNNNWKIIDAQPDLIPNP